MGRNDHNIDEYVYNETLKETTRKGVGKTRTATYNETLARVGRSLNTALQIAMK